MPKRKTTHAEAEAQPETHPLRRSTRKKLAAPPPPQQHPPKSTPAKRTGSTSTNEEAEAKARTATTRARAKTRRTSPSGGDVNGAGDETPRQPAQVRSPAPGPGAGAGPDDDGTAPAAAGAGRERQYWLMKAEPESRLEKGVDVRFSIDDLAARTEPEPWDGIRNFVARNNLRAMRKGDLAFFYHSNCKQPGIVGTMEIVGEHMPDLSAHDPKAPYYDPKSRPQDPRWSVVHVRFRSKLRVPIGLGELRERGGPGGPLAGMQVLRQPRLSVSRVSAAEWGYLMGVADDKAAAVRGGGAS